MDIVGTIVYAVLGVALVVTLIWALDRAIKRFIDYARRK